jgi:hypothetical protein
MSASRFWRVEHMCEQVRPNGPRHRTRRMGPLTNDVGRSLPHWTSKGNLFQGNTSPPLDVFVEDTRAASGRPPLVMQPGERPEICAELRVVSGEADPCAPQPQAVEACAACLDGRCGSSTRAIPHGSDR